MKSWNRGDGPRDGFYTDDIQNGVYFLRVNNLKNHTIDIDDVKYITRYVHDNTLKRAQVTAGYLVFSISGTKENLGTVSIIPNNILEANLNSALVRLELNWSIIDKRYFCYMFDLNTTRIQINFIGKGAAQNNLNNEEISQIHIFIPSISEQEKIVNYLDEAHLKKKQKETEAQRSLESIDDYLLSELGIHLPEPEENTIQNRIFYRSIKMISGDRIDPYAYKNIVLETLKNIKEYKYENRTLRQITKPVINGFDYRDFCDSGRVYLRVSNIRKDEFSLEDVRFIPEFLIEKDIALIEGDLLLTRKGSYGISVVVDKSILHAVISSEIFRLRFLNLGKINPYFISAYLNSKIGQIYFDRIKTGAIMGHISQDVLQHTPIIVPPIEKQIEIVDRITTIRDRAKQLRQEGVAELEKAKQEVEAMILGIE
ncbi:restriction endonuclease subunit S [Brunnivagina elsteri]|uniref:restriction endonuclease subunit S n=1 Tax=Brunnivagina elsteri TaxID=1247191 RepID=UPI003184551C